MSNILMTRIFTFPGLKPFSVNASYIRTHAGIAKSSGANEFSSQLFNYMHREADQIALRELRELFDETKHVFHVGITAYYPAPEFYTKKGTISNKTIDMSNGEKLILDCLMLPKFHTEPFPQGAPNINADDRFITQMVSGKEIGDERSIRVRVQILNKP